jgi:DNA-directed RNA polymerase specialized sigma24 family protein
VHSLGQQARDEDQKIGSIALEDSQLAAAVLSKDRKATAEFVAGYSDSVYGYIHSRLAPRSDQVEDLVQEVFLSAWEI